MTIESYIIYITTVFIATIVPGPSMLLALNHGIFYGTKKTVVSALGNLVANLLMALISIAGLGAIIIASGTAFNIIKWVGAAYLIYIGVKTWSAPVNDSEEESGISPESFSKKSSLFKMFMDSFLIAAGNPKGIIFFTALFPQFIDLKSATSAQVVLIFIPLIIIAFGCFMLYAAFGNKITGFLKSKSPMKLLNKITGGTFIGIGMAVAVSE